ncbi:MAG: TonB-dependent receptor [Bacteroidota bacterium]
MIKYIYILFFLPLFTFGQPGTITLKGQVLDAGNKPIQFAAIRIKETNEATYSDINGRYTLLLKHNFFQTLTLQVSFVGKQSVIRTLQTAAFSIAQTIILLEQSLTLNDVVVTAQRKRSEVSNSSIVFDRQSIDQIQAFSLADILNNLPGKTMSPPNLQYKQNVTLRSAGAIQDPVQLTNNAMGVAIYIDGMRQSNDANMQTRNVGAFGITGGAIANTADPGIGNPQYDTPFSGLDVRNIPADNIESVEVVSGVASAKYGELTDGAIIINRMAGKTDYRVNLRLNGTSTNAAISKGFKLPGKAGALNTNFNYLNSVQDPRDNTKNYSRLSGGLMWSIFLNKAIKNTFSADYSHKIDNAKLDPDDDTQQITYSKERRLGFTNRTSITVNSNFLQRINLGLSYDVGYQESYRQRYNNTSAQGVADKDTTGIYEGYYVPGNFLSIDHIIGKPYNAAVNLDLINNFSTGSLEHNLSFGSNFSTSGNSGQGVIADPSHPYLNIAGNKSVRPYSFDLLRDIYNIGFYAEDRTLVKVFNKPLSVTAGVRYDLQNGYPSVQPRINTSYQLNSQWAVRAAFGIASKAPSMSYRYPGPTYFDITLINAYNTFVNESLYLVYTRKIEQDNSRLKPSKASQIELGTSFESKWINSSLYIYLKRNRDGLNSSGVFMPIYLPTYTVTPVPGGKPTYAETGQYKLYASLSDLRVGNHVNSDNYGAEWFVSTRKIPVLQTSFNLNTSVGYSYFNNTGTAITKVDDSYIIRGNTAWYGIYKAIHRKEWSVISKLSSDTHIPHLGFVVSLMADFYWYNVRQALGNSQVPIAYIDKDGNTIPIPVFDNNNTDYNYLLLSSVAGTKVQDPPFVYGNLSLRLAKEVRKKLRISVFAYNFLNIRVKYYNRELNSAKTYNSPVNVGAELAYKF